MILKKMSILFYSSLNGLLLISKKKEKFYCLLICMGIQEKRIYSCMVIVSKTIRSIRKEYFLIYWKNKLKYLATLIVHLMFKNQRKGQGELLDGRSLEFKIPSRLKLVFVAVILESMQIFILIPICFKK